MTVTATLIYNQNEQNLWTTHTINKSQPSQVNITQKSAEVALDHLVARIEKALKHKQYA